MFVEKTDRSHLLLCFVLLQVRLDVADGTFLLQLNDMRSILFSRFNGHHGLLVRLDFTFFLLIKIQDNNPRRCNQICLLMYL